MSHKYTHEYYLKYKEKIAAGSKRYREKNKEKLAAYHKAYMLANGDKVRAKKRESYEKKLGDSGAKPRKRYRGGKITKVEINRMHRYGITPDIYNAMLSSQDGGCAICKTKESGGRGNTPHIDHCHTTKKVRGLLCNRCNVALGLVKDNIETLLSMIEYLRKNTP